MASYQYIYVMKGLNKTFPGGKQVLKDIWLSFLPGAKIGVLGLNGAGKSTLLKILSRITEPTSGRAEIHGRVGSLLEVGTGFHPELTGRENIYLNGAILGMRRAEIERKFDEIVAFAEIERFLDTPVKAPHSVQRHAYGACAWPSPSPPTLRHALRAVRAAPGAGDLS